MTLHGIIEDVENYFLVRARNLKKAFLAPEKRFIHAGKISLERGEREMHELPNLVKPDTIAIDVGANIGEYAYSLCKLIGDNGRVICIEPIKDMADVISKAAKRLQLPITVYNCGLSSESGSAELYIPHENGRRQTALASFNKPETVREKHTIQLRRLDDITDEIEGDISFIKIDVEGHEQAVLKGGIETLKKYSPNLLIEIEERHSPVPISQTFSMLKELGYDGFFLNSERDHIPLSEFDLYRNQILPEVKSPEYINNFIFKHS